MSAAGSMHMGCTCNIGLAPVGRVGTNLNHVFVYVVAMHVMEVPVMQIIDMALMTDRNVAAILTMLVPMLCMVAP